MDKNLHLRDRLNNQHCYFSIAALLTPEQNHQLMQLISTKLSDPNSSACSYVTDTTDNNHLSANENIARSRSSCMSENNKRFINNCMSQNNRRFESRNVQGSEKTENIQVCFIYLVLTISQINILWLRIPKKLNCHVMKK